MTITLYGIPNCDTVKKARAWLDGQGVAHAFHDYKTRGVPEARLDAWIEELGWEPLLNRRGPTWRKLDTAVQAGVTDAPGAKKVMVSHPSVIKRPVVEWGGRTTVGFDPAAWALLARR